MYIYKTEYYEEIDHGEFESERYNLIGLYLSENEALKAKDEISEKKKIKKELLFVSATKLGKLQWKGGFVTV